MAIAESTQYRNLRRVVPHADEENHQSRRALMALCNGACVVKRGQSFDGPRGIRLKRIRDVLCLANVGSSNQNLHAMPHYSLGSSCRYLQSAVCVETVSSSSVLRVVDVRRTLPVGNEGPLMMTTLQNTHRQNR